ncbi:MAG: type II CRISPR RNA-guided endonuclease Cas9, partial [Planctomyces sp.]
SNPSRADVEKWQLAEECNWRCPYTGRQISAATLSNFDVEHIYPRQYLDDSFGNKTLCDPDFNRARKRNRLPGEVLEGAELAEVLGRVRHFKGPYAESKLRRFQAESVPEDFVSRQLNDTRYNSRLAAEFLQVLYGGRSDSNRQKRIVTPTGGLTWLIRRGFGLDRILSDGDYKERADHRQHAVDAICVALSTQKVIQRLSRLAGELSRSGERFHAFLSEFSRELPWPEFQADAAQTVQNIIVSHRPDRAISGGQHAETYYSRPLPAPSDGQSEGKRGRSGKSRTT